MKTQLEEHIGVGDELDLLLAVGGIVLGVGLLGFLGNGGDGIPQRGLAVAEQPHVIDVVAHRDPGRVG